VVRAVPRLFASVRWTIQELPRVSVGAGKLRTCLAELPFSPADVVDTSELIQRNVMRTWMVGTVGLVLAVRLLTKLASSSTPSDKPHGLLRVAWSGWGLPQLKGWKPPSSRQSPSSTRLGHAPRAAFDTIPESFDHDPEYLNQFCGSYLKKSFNNLKQRDAVFERMLTTDLRGSGCWLRMRPYVCHYSDRNPLYSAGVGAPVEGLPDQCEALLKARLDRLNRFRTLESRRVSRAQLEAAVQDLIGEMERWTFWRQVLFSRRIRKRERSTSKR
jgi:hypothetical protein